MKKFAVMLIIAVFAILTGGYFYLTGKNSIPIATMVAVDDKTPDFAPEVEKVLSAERAVIQSLANEQIIIEETRVANKRDENIGITERNKLDQDWKNSKEASPFIRTFLENKTAKFLLDFQKTHPYYKEIFVADAYGLNVGQTDKTSDYYQADESWWTNSFNNGEGKLMNGEIEFDESSQSEAISIYAPIIDPGAGRAIGVLKAVLDVSSLINKL